MKYKNLYIFSVLLLLLLPVVALAQFKPLVGIPGIDPSAGFSDYINALYALSISIAGLLAVIKIIIAGVKYMLSDVVSTKSDAKGDIQGALIGLLIIISAVVVLNQINPQLTQSKLFLTPVSPVPGPGDGNKINRTAAPTGAIVNSDGSQSESITRMACTARAGQGETATFSVLYSAGTVDYGTCTITKSPTATSPETPFTSTLIWSGTGISSQVCAQNATARNGEARYTERISKCEVWSKPTSGSQNTTGPQ
jgi:hypothetical protein